MPTKEPHETPETHVEKRLKRLWVRIGETLKRLRSIFASVVTGMGQWWSAMGARVEQGRQCGLFGRI
jgi:hypothetical protein